MTNDHIRIDGFEVPCRVGITTEERAFPQVLRISLRLELPLGKAGASDNLRDTVDYAGVIEEIRQTLKRKDFKLVEAVAEAIAEVALRQPLAHAAEVTVDKKIFDGIEAVGVFIRREKKA